MNELINILIDITCIALAFAVMVITFITISNVRFRMFFSRAAKNALTALLFVAMLGVISGVTYVNLRAKQAIADYRLRATCVVHDGPVYRNA